MSAASKEIIVRHRAFLPVLIAGSLLVAQPVVAQTGERLARTAADRLYATLLRADAELREDDRVWRRLGAPPHFGVWRLKVSPDRKEAYLLRLGLRGCARGDACEWRLYRTASRRYVLLGVFEGAELRPQGQASSGYFDFVGGPSDSTYSGYERLYRFDGQRYESIACRYLVDGEEPRHLGRGCDHHAACGSMEGSGRSVPRR
jgi:hypothetical protein